MNIHPQLAAALSRRRRASASAVISQEQFEYEESQKHLRARHPLVRDQVWVLQDDYERALRRAINTKPEQMEVIK